MDEVQIYQENLYFEEKYCKKVFIKDLKLEINNSVSFSLLVKFSKTASFPKTKGVFILFSLDYNTHKYIKLS